MNDEKWYDECSVVAYPHEIKFLHIDGGSMSFYVDRNISEYVSKLQAQINTLQNENREKTIKNMILQSKIDKAIEYIEEHTDKLKTIRIPKTDFNYKKLLDILKENK